MWITQRLIKSTKQDTVETASVTSSSDEILLQGEKEYRQPQMIFPYGFCSKIPEGEKTAVLNSCVIGVVMAGVTDIEAGEVAISSQGGAKIILKNNGDVYINGQCFPKS